MRTNRSYLLGIVSLIFILINSNFASGQEERILSYNSDIQLNPENELMVTETIKVVAKGIEIRRGIFRVLPENKSKSNPLKDVSYDIVSVKRDGKEEPYHLKNENGNTVVYIGEKTSTSIRAFMYMSCNTRLQIMLDFLMIMTNFIGMSPATTGVFI